ncbi:hypothetical protein JTB14_001378 [Gonioctena quinquepunctata]|nr:hypothetical protein JTB14_001378 [Gonioctena quinquepunctata]
MWTKLYGGTHKLGSTTRKSANFSIQPKGQNSPHTGETISQHKENTRRLFEQDRKTLGKPTAKVKISHNIGTKDDTAPVRIDERLDSNMPEQNCSES